MQKIFLFFWIILIISCTHINYNERITLPVIIHVPPNESISETGWSRFDNSKQLLNQGNIDIVVKEIKNDAPLEAPGLLSSRNEFYKLVDKKHIHIFFIDKANNFLGISLSGMFVKNIHNETFILICDSTSDSTIAHEIGHMFGLDHILNKKNIMSDGLKRIKIGLSFNNRQIKKMKRHIHKSDIIIK